MNEAKFMIASAMLSAQWERAKGELRAAVAIKGNHQSGLDSHEAEVWMEFSKRVEAFIKEMEDEGLAE